MALTQISTNGVKDGSLLNADINASAAIAKSKIETFVNNNADNRVITGSGTANTLNGNSDLLWNGSRLDIDTGGTEDCFRIGNSAGCDTALRIGSINTATDTHGVIKYDKDDNYLSLLVSGESHGNGGILIANGGNVGISTTSPSSKLHVKGSGEILRLETTATTGSNYINFNDADENKAFIGLGSGSDDSLSITLVKSSNLRFATSNTERMRIDSSGNVGIGMTTVGAALDVNGASGDTLRLSNGSASAQYRIGRNSTDGKLEFFGTQSGDIAYTFGGVDGERMRLDSSGRLMLGTTTAVGSNTPNLQVKAVSPASGFDNHIYLEGNETSGAANTGGQIGFGGHDGNTARNWAAISGFKTNGNSGNTSSYLSFKTRRSGVNGVNEMWRMTAMGSLLARDDKESAVGREFTNGSVPAGQTRDHTDNSRLNFNSIGGNGGGHITCLSVSSQDQNPSGAMIIAGVHGQGFNTYNTILSNFDSGISVTFSGGTVSIQNTSSETIYYSVNVIHMGTGNTTYLGR